MMSRLPGMLVAICALLAYSSAARTENVVLVELSNDCSLQALNLGLRL